MLLTKAILYRIFRVLIVMLISGLITGSFVSAISISLVDAVEGTLYYYYYDKSWPSIEKHIKHILYKIKYKKFDL